MKLRNFSAFAKYISTDNTDFPSDTGAPSSSSPSEAALMQPAAAAAATAGTPAPAGTTTATTGESIIVYRRPPPPPRPPPPLPVILYRQPRTRESRNGQQLAKEQASSGTAAQIGLQDLEPILKPWFQTMVQQHLTPISRRQLFRTSTALATAVMTHAPAVALTLHMPRHGSLERRQKALSTLLAAVPDSRLQVQFANGVCGILWSCVPKQQVVKVAFRNVQITADMLVSLQLQECTNLHALSLGELCTATESNIAALAATDTAWLPHTVTQLSVATQSTQDRTAPLLQLITAQVTALVCAALPAPLPTLLTSLTHVEFSAAFCGELRSRHSAPDQLLSVVMRMPSVTHVTFAGEYQHSLFRQDHTRLRLRQLQFRRPPRLSCLLRLPLQHIQCLVLHVGLECDVWSDSAAGGQHLLECAELQCVPAVDTQGYGARLGCRLPKFVLWGMWDLALADRCGNSLTASGILELDMFDVWQFGPNKPGLMLQPARNVASLGLCVPRTCSPPSDVCTVEEHWQRVLSGLPPHLRHLVLKTSQPSETWWRHLTAIVKVIVRDDYFDKITIHVSLSEYDKVPLIVEALVAARPDLVHLHIRH